MCTLCETLSPLERAALHTPYNKAHAEKTFPAKNYRAESARRVRKTAKRNAVHRIITAHRKVTKHGD